MTKHTSTADIIAALTTTAGDITAAASLLGLRREAIYYRINKDPDLKHIIEALRTAHDPTTDNTDQAAAPTEQAGPATESAPAPNEGENAPERETPAPIGTPAEKPAEKLPYITQCIIRQEAANLSAYLKSYITNHGLPRQYGEVIGYIEYLDKTAAGNT